MSERSCVVTMSDGTSCGRPAQYAAQDPTRTGASKGATTTKMMCDLHAVQVMLNLRETVELFRAARTSAPLSFEGEMLLTQTVADLAHGAATLDVSAL